MHTYDMTCLSYEMIDTCKKKCMCIYIQFVVYDRESVVKFWNCTKDTLRVFCEISTEPFRPPGHNHSAKHARNGKWLRLRATPSGEGLSSSTDIELVSYVVKKLVVKKVDPTGKEPFPIWHRCTMNGGCSIAMFMTPQKLRLFSSTSDATILKHHRMDFLWKGDTAEQRAKDFKIKQAPKIGKIWNFGA